MIKTYQKNSVTLKLQEKNYEHCVEYKEINVNDL